MQDKFTQVNEFLKLLGHTGMVEQLRSRQASDTDSTSSDATAPNTAPHNTMNSDSTAVGDEAGPVGGRPIRILDCGCGSSHLTFGTYHYLNNVLGIPTQINGVDSNTMLMDKSNSYW